MDKLILYSILILIINLINISTYIFICKRKFDECQFRFEFDKILFIEMLHFISWNLLQTIAGTLINQGSTILLNVFFGPIVNTAKAISNQVNGAIITFASHFSAAIQPQLIKSYATANYDKLNTLLFWGTKITFLLFFIFLLPLILETPFILNLWLGIYPDYTEIFTRLALITTSIEIISYSMDTLAQATGRIRLYQVTISIILLLNLPISYFLLKQGFPPYWIILTNMGLVVIANCARIYILSLIIKSFKIFNYFVKVLLPILVIVVLSSIFPIIITLLIQKSIFRLFLVVIICFINVIMFSFFLALNKEEKYIINRIIMNKIFTKKK